MTNSRAALKPRMDNTLQVVDYVELIATICISLFFAIYLTFKQRKYPTTFGYHRASGKLTAVPVAMPLFVTFKCSISFLGNPAQVYIYGFKYWLVNVG